MKINVLFGLFFILFLSACDKSEYDLDNIVPPQYHKIMYINNSGTHNVSLSTNQVDTFNISIFKGGSQHEVSASVNLTVLSQEHVDSIYSEKDKVDYKVINSDCYTLEPNHLEFSSADYYKVAKVLFNNQKVRQLIADNPNVNYVVPIGLSSANDLINADKSEVFLIVNDFN